MWRLWVWWRWPNTCRLRRHSREDPARTSDCGPLLEWERTSMMRIITPGTFSHHQPNLSPFQTRREIVFRQMEGLWFLPWLFWYNHHGAVRQWTRVAGKWWLDHLSRSPVRLCNGKLEFVTINWTPCRWAPHPLFDTYVVSVRGGGQGRGNRISVWRCVLNIHHSNAIPRDWNQDGVLDGAWSTSSRNDSNASFLPFRFAYSIGSWWWDVTGAGIGWPIRSGLIGACWKNKSPRYQATRLKQQLHPLYSNMVLTKQPGKEIQVYRPRTANPIRIRGMTTEAVHIITIFTAFRHTDNIIGLRWC